MILEVWADTGGATSCKSCFAAITFYQVKASGRRMPFDGSPVFVATRHDPETRRLLGSIDTEIDKTHFETCPDAGKWRKR